MSSEPPDVRVLLFTGKGGVGKTTTAAATALRCAERGHRTLVTSTDPAHSLADALAVPLGDRPVAVADRLHAQQLDARARLEESWGELRAFLTEVLAWAGVSAVEAEELTVLPGLDELFALVDVQTHATSGQYDVIVVDCAPTADTLRLLSLPEVLGWWMQRLFPLTRQVTKVVGPLVRQLGGVPVAGEGVFDAVERLTTRLGAVRALLADGERTSVRVVVTPERVVVAEARRLLTHLALFGYRADLVVANRILPDVVVDPWFDRWKQVQAAQLDDLIAGFSPLPVLRVPLAGDEPVGLAHLSDFATAVYGERDPASSWSSGEVLHLDHRGADWVLGIDLPFAERDDLRLTRRGDEVLVSIGPYRRAILLPEVLARRRVVDATLRQGRLEVVFGDA